MITEEQFNQLMEGVSALEQKMSDLDLKSQRLRIEEREAKHKAMLKECELERERMKGTVLTVKVHKKIAAGQFCSEYYKGYSLPGTLEEIGRGVFNDCEYLESLEIPASVKKIGAQLCKGCKSLKSVRFLGSCPEGLVGAFSGCKALEEVFVPEGEAEAYKAKLTLVADKVK